MGLIFFADGITHLFLVSLLHLSLMFHDVLDPSSWLIRGEKFKRDKSRIPGYHYMCKRILPPNFLDSA